MRSELTTDGAQFAKEDIHRIHLSYPRLSQEQQNNWYGIVRDFRRALEFKTRNPDRKDIEIDEENKVLKKEFNGYDTSLRRKYPDHIDSCVERKDGPLFVIGNGNLDSNSGIAGYKGDEILKVAWEEKRIQKEWKYSFFHIADGIARIDQFDFNHKPSATKWGTSGQPILWDGVPVSSKYLLPETYDLRHIYQLPKDNPRALEVLRSLTESWVEIFEQCGQDEAADRLDEKVKEISKNFELKTEDEYLQSAIGVDDKGNVYIIQKHASLRNLALMLKEKGATRGILLDQGGSVGRFYRSPNFKKSEYIRKGGFIACSPDLRDTRLCTLVFELEKDPWIGA